MGRIGLRALGGGGFREEVSASAGNRIDSLNMLPRHCSDFGTRSNCPKAKRLMGHSPLVERQKSSA